MFHNKLKGLFLAAIIITGTGIFAGCNKDSVSSAGNSTQTNYFDMEFHRGGRDARPENTLYTYQYAIENGASVIECDMQLSADGVLVMSHNPSLNPDITTYPDGRRVEKDTYYINDMSLNEIKNFNVGIMDTSCEYYMLHGRSQVMNDAEIPTLRELFELVRDSGDEAIRMSIEAKSYPDPSMGIIYEKSPDKTKMLEEFVALVKEFGYENRVSLQSFDWDILVASEKKYPEIETVALYSEQPSWGSADATTLWLDKDEASPWLGGINIHDFDDNPVKAAHFLKIDNVSPYYEEITPELVAEAHDYGMKVIVWTVNNSKAMEAVYEMGVDGIITDRPWVLKDFLESKNENLKPSTNTNLPYHLEPDHIDVEDLSFDGGMESKE